MQVDRRRFAQALAAAMAVVPAACARPPRPLRVWAMGVEGEALRTFADGFHDVRPDIDIVVQALPWSAAHEKLLTAFAADNLPDVLAMGNTWLPEFAALGALEPLDPWMKKAGRTLDTVFPGARQAATIGGHILAVPWYVDTRLLFYRRDLLHSAGFDIVATTWAQWQAQLAALSRDGRFGVLMPINEYEPLVAFCLQTGAPILIDDATRGGFSQPAIRAAFAFTASLYADGYAAKVTNAEIADLYGGFARADFAFLISGPWNLAELSARLPPSLQDAWATAPLPGPDGPGASLAGGVSLTIPRVSRAKDQAFAFIDYMCRPERQADIYRACGDLPADQEAWQNTGLMRQLRSRAFFEQLNLARPAPPAPEWERIANEMAAAMERVVRGLQTLDAALKGLDEFAFTVLAKRRWLLEKGRAA